MAPPIWTNELVALAAGVPLKERLVVLFCSVRALKVGAEPVAMSWIVLMTPAPLSLKLVALKAAIPLVAPSALASLMVMVLPPVVALAIEITPLRPLTLVTPPPAPPVQAWKLRLPAPSVNRQSPLPPSAAGRKKVRSLAGSVAGACRVTECVPALFKKATEPSLVLAVPRVRLPLP